LALEDKNGVLHQGHNEITGIVVNYFEKLFPSDGSSQMGTVLDCIEMKVTDDMNSLLCANCFETEVLEALNK